MGEYRDTLISKLVNKGSFRALVDAKCIDCSYDESDKGTWRQQVEACRVPSCPLYSRRPKSSKGREGR